MTDQSEPIEGTPGYKLHYDMTQICFANGGVTKPMVDKLFAYITANYTPNSEVARQVREARIEELTGLLSMQKNKPRRVLLKDAVNIAYSRVCELSDVKKLHEEANQ